VIGLPAQRSTAGVCQRHVGSFSAHPVRALDLDLELREYERNREEIEANRQGHLALLRAPLLAPG
jgi:hypothetical protein